MAIRFPILYAATTKHLLWCEKCDPHPVIRELMADYYYLRDSLDLAEAALNDNRKRIIKHVQVIMRANHTETINGVRYVPVSINQVTDALIQAFEDGIDEYALKTRQLRVMESRDPIATLIKDLRKPRPLIFWPLDGTNIARISLPANPAK